MLQEVISKWRYRQYMYCIAALVCVTASEIHGSWTSPFIPQLESEDSPIGVQLTTISAMYIGEIADNDNRGRMGYFNVLSSTCGSVIGLVIGPFVSYRIFAIIAICTVVFAFICLLLIPETPYFLIRKHKHKNAEAIVWKLASNSSDKEFVNKRLEEIMESVQKDMTNKSSINELLCSGKYIKCICIHGCLNMLLYMSGSSIIRSYLQTILNASESSISSNLSSLIFGIVNIIAVFFSGQVVDRLGRKPLLLTSCIVSAISMFILGAYFYINETKSFNMAVVTWLPLTSLVVYEIFIAVGISPIPQVVTSELYPINVKGIAIGTVGAILAPIAVLVQMSYEPLNNFWGLYGSFWMYCVCCILGIFFTIFLLPETKGKSFQQIQMEINKKRVDTEGVVHNSKI
ncbi:facilitated trehalose transporter Tret1-like isoform X1 [Agrilus planipennis]|uniref:Facilitated trehalose transporter Tret1-like isoform X1 n=1 Tax=Agrilus planipennis TaxID=224129 RepID=A0A1W4XCV4_AGRPL|nr:facilitated trehalose transporter Tret1-like isoform X1 [Agrilus planipennis]XP_025833319.1 facilitated trehalose transporter Tret1-like isoform X1 [Agrilus planipennis]